MSDDDDDTINASAERKVSANSTDEFEDYVLDMILTKFTSRNGIPKYSIHVSFMNIIEEDFSSGKILLNFKVTLKWIDFRRHSKSEKSALLDDTTYPFEPKLLLRNLVEIVSEFKSQTAQVINKLTFANKFTMYNMEKIYHWNAWVRVKPNSSLFRPFTRYVAVVEFFLMKFRRNLALVQAVKDKMQIKTTHRAFFGEFSYYRSPLRVFLWEDMKVKKKKDDVNKLLTFPTFTRGKTNPMDNYELGYRRRNSDETHRRSVVIKTAYKKTSMENMAEVYIESPIENIDGRLTNTPTIGRLLSVTYPYFDDQRRVTDKLVVDQFIHEIKGNRFYSCFLQVRRASVYHFALNLTPIWLIMAYHFSNDLTEESYISLLFSLIAYKFTIKDQLSQDSNFSFLDINLFLMMIINLLVFVLKTNDFDRTANVVLGAVLIISFAVTAFIFVRHVIAVRRVARQDIRDIGVERNPSQINKDNRKTILAELVTLYSALRKAGMEPDLDENRMRMLGTSDQLYERMYEIAEELNKHVKCKKRWQTKSKASVQRKVTQGRSLHDLVRTRMSLVELRDNIKKMAELGYQSFSLDLDFLTFRELEDDVVGKAYFLKADRVDALIVEVQLRVSSRL